MAEQQVIASEKASGRATPAREQKGKRAAAKAKPVEEPSEGSKRAATKAKPVEEPSEPEGSKNDMACLLGLVKEQSAALSNLTSRLDELDNNEYEYDYEQYECEPDPPDTVDASSGKRKLDEVSEPGTSRFSAMSKRFKTREICGPKIDQTLAENVTDLFKNGMSEEQFNELAKDEANARPENCVGLGLVRCNQLIWDILSPHVQSTEGKMQNIQKALVKAATLLVNVVDTLAKDPEEPNVDTVIDSCNDVVAVMGHANRKINTTRRELIKPELSSQYVHLCSQAVEYTSWLFGDDLSKTAKEIEDCSKIGLKLGLGANRGYSRPPRYRGRGRGYRGRGRGGYGRGRGGGYDPKNNFPRKETAQKPKAY